jgi:hypothetical protein
MKEIAENNFEVAYKEYKEYETFFLKKVSSAEDRRKEIAQYVLDNRDNQDATVNKVFESGVGYLFHEKDLKALRTKLYHIFKAYEDILEIPQEIKTEINNFKIEPLNFFIENGEAKEVNKELFQQIKTQIKQEYTRILEESLKTLEDE